MFTAFCTVFDEALRVPYSKLFVFLSARSSVWIERLPPEQKVRGSNPLGRTTFQTKTKHLAAFTRQLSRDRTFAGGRILAILTSN
jgi:hypothetical protein